MIDLRKLGLLRHHLLQFLIDLLDLDDLSARSPDHPSAVGVVEVAVGVHW